MTSRREVGLDQALRALAHPVRRELLWLAWGEWRTAGDLTEFFELRQPTVSQHLKVLREAGLLEMKRSGTKRLFRVQTGALREVYSLLQAAIGATGLTLPSGDVSQEPAYGPYSVRISARVPCPPSEAYLFFTQADRMELWLGPKVRVENRPGGVFAFEIDGKWRCRGRFHALEPPSRVLFVWSFREGSVPLPSGSNTVEVTLGGVRTTKVVVEHHGFEEDLVQTHRESWRRMLKELAVAVERGAGRRSS